MAHDGQSGGEIVMDMIDRVRGRYTAFSLTGSNIDRRDKGEGCGPPLSEILYTNLLREYNNIS